MRRTRAAVLAALIAATSACGTKTPPEREPTIPPEPSAAAGPDSAAPGVLLPGESVELPKEPDFSTGRTVRVALHTDAERVTIAGTGAWRLYDQNGASLLLRADAGDAWTVKPEHGDLRAERSDGQRTARRTAPFVARPAGKGSFVTVNGRAYRGEIVVRPAKKGLIVVNRLSVEDYLRGVVPLEIGHRTTDERAAVEAQAIAARSYALAHLRTDAARQYDLLATVSDQVYGGAEAETAVSDAAIEATRSLVLTYQGRVIAAPYSANCGGRTAAAEEAWGGGSSAYLTSVSDRANAGGDRFYCDIAPHFRWTRTFSRKDLAQALERNLRTFVTVDGSIGAATDLRIDHRTTSGRVGSLVIMTDRGRYTLRGNDIRFVLRAPGGEILPSTMFSLEMDRDGDGRVEKLTVSGAGNGHGVGMCQWGAIGRARAGQSARAILKTYYPGTIVTALPE
jgi:stage II sporulation protein D